MSKKKYDVVLSFAGEDRDYADQLAQLLEQKSVSVFYDMFEQAKLWGKDLYEYLSQIYSNDSEYCIMFLSKFYASKAWTTHERKNAQERAFKENREYILPIKIDDTEIPGITSTTGYIDIRHTSIKEIAKMVLTKLGKEDNIQVNQVEEDDFEIPMPKIPKEFTDYEKDQFKKETFNTIQKYFEKATKNLELKVENTNCEIEEITKYKFIVKIYLNGQLKNQCKIWIGGMFTRDSISYSEGQFDIHQDNSINDEIRIESDNESIYLSPLGTDFFGLNKIPEKANAKQAAEYFWSKFIQNLTY